MSQMPPPGPPMDYPPPGYAPGPEYYGPPPPVRGTGLAMTAMILGIISIPAGLCVGILGAPFFIAGFICGLISLAQKRPGRGMAVAGVICSAVGLGAMILAVIVGVAMMNSGGFNP